jgi:hypothetical protein
MIKEVYREGHFFSRSKAEAIQVAGSQDIGAGRILKATGSGA